MKINYAVCMYGKKNRKYKWYRNITKKNVILTNELLDLEKNIKDMNISHSDFEIFKKLCNINDIIKDINDDYRNILENI